MITATNPLTGEIFELNVGTPEELETAYLTIKSFEKTAKELMEQLKRVIRKQNEETIPTPNGYIKVTQVQKKTYDKGILRTLIDEDTLDDFLFIKKSAVDKWLAEGIKRKTIPMELNQDIIAAQIPDGNPYVEVRLVKG